MLTQKPLPVTVSFACEPLPVTVASMHDGGESITVLKLKESSAIGAFAVCRF